VERDTQKARAEEAERETAAFLAEVERLTRQRTGERDAANAVYQKELARRREAEREVHQTELKAGKVDAKAAAAEDSRAYWERSAKYWERRNGEEKRRADELQERIAELEAEVARAYNDGYEAMGEAGVLIADSKLQKRIAELEAERDELQSRLAAYEDGEWVRLPDITDVLGYLSDGWQEPREPREAWEALLDDLKGTEAVYDVALARLADAISSAPEPREDVVVVTREQVQEAARRVPDSTLRVIGYLGIDRKWTQVLLAKEPSE
jgi:chromosome segregation ATPase